MRILFNLCNVGLAKNGGSNTLIHSANILKNLGHDVTIIDTFKNPKTWVDINCTHRIIKNEKDIPNADIVIATGFKSFKHTIDLPKRCGIKFVWLRGWETWQSPELNMVKILRTNEMIKIVNSFGLSNKLKQFNIKSHLVRPGNDFNNFSDLNIRNKNKNIILGGLYHTRHKTKNSSWVIKAKKDLNKKYGNIKLIMFGSDKINSNNDINEYICQPNINEKNILFNKVNIWLSPSNLEGLHIVPQEALLTNCPVVTVDAELSGTIDYIKHENNGLISSNNYKDFLYNIDYLIKNKKVLDEMSVEEKCRNSIIGLGSRKENMDKLINIFKIYMDK